MATNTLAELVLNEESPEALSELFEDDAVRQLAAGSVEQLVQLTTR